VTRGHVRRAKLYYLRERKGKKARIRERRLTEEELLAAAVRPEVDEAEPEEGPSEIQVAEEEPVGETEQEPAPEEAEAAEGPSAAGDQE